MKNLENLTQDELLQLESALPQIAVLIAGADGTIDAEESAWADKLAHIRSYAGEKWLQAFYQQVDANFHIKFSDLVKSLPKDTATRQHCLSAELAKLNPVLAKLEPENGYEMYQSLQTFAKSIAKASGGFLGFASVSGEEEKWVGLPMLTPIAKPEPKEEQDAAE
jgi:hypothetical protein